VVAQVSLSMDVSGRVAIVTGGTRGLGREIAVALTDAGCRVAVCGRQDRGDLPAGVAFYPVDVRDPDLARGFVDAVARDFGRLDVLVNNAGGSPHAGALASGVRFTESVLRLNLVAPFHLAQAAHPHMAAVGGGSIVNIASVSGQRPSPDTAIYGAAKAGLINLTQSLAQEWGPDGIRVNAVIAGLMQTENAAATYGGEDIQQRVASSIPLRRMGTGGDIAGAVLWLCSPLSGWVSGARINVDGGGERPHFLELLKGH
jgi:NAD(P)-dependent dehydrogenase (short-subunit alcohol dehydrogenase family)